MSLGADALTAMPARRVFSSTLEALLAPRRAVPIAIIAAPLLVLQARLSRDAYALPLAIAMIGSFLLVAPTLWRVFFPTGVPRRSVLAPALVYAAVGVILVVGVGRGVPMLVGMGATFLTTRESLLVSTALFWVGGWGLGRDIDLEANLAREKARAEALAREAERAHLLALKSHLDPHFLFNTLNAIAEWCREDGAVAERAILQLSTMLRTVMTGIGEPLWPLAREIELIDALFALYLIRDPELFALRRAVDLAALTATVPPMLLLNLAENAMKHGPSAGHRGDVDLRVWIEGDDVNVRIENPGRFTGPRAGASGLPVFERRLRLAYRGEATFRIQAHGDRTVAEVRFPRHPRDEERA
jgi:signal transduction histidine kinase